MVQPCYSGNILGGRCVCTQKNKELQIDTNFHHSRFKFSYLYELDSLAVVNVRDLGGIKHAFKLLVFPDARLFQCANGDAKQVRNGARVWGMLRWI